METQTIAKMLLQELNINLNPTPTAAPDLCFIDRGNDRISLLASGNILRIVAFIEKDPTQSSLIADLADPNSIPKILLHIREWHERCLLHNSSNK
jgi:hypothetical protein